MRTIYTSSGQVPSTVPGTLKLFIVGYGQRIHSFTKSLLMLLKASFDAGDMAVDLRQMSSLLLGSLQTNSTHVNS